MDLGDKVQFHELRVFLAVAELLHFGRAAQRLGISQSRVSQIIRELEHAIGGPLFTRTSRRVGLTALGERLRTSVEGPLAELRRGLGTTAAAAGGLRGRVRIGFATPLAAGPLMPEIARRFGEQYPGCAIEYIDLGFDRDLLSCLRGNEIDLLASRLPVNREDLTVEPVLTCERRVLAVSRDHPLAAYAAVSWDDVADYPVHNLPFLPEEAARDLVPEYASTGRPIRRGPDARTFNEILLQVAHGDVVQPTVASYGDYHRHPGVVAVPLKDPTPSRSGLVWPTSAIAPAARAFVECACEIVAERPRHRID
ncbi:MULTISPECIES: LysR family transcriptional regulator [unclassified Nocardia]|uniref:LysR family transcriptional regulator n=1 Tax=unclassified Nocardia TaxID=2637762 RepID=UPI001CE3FB70|nr:MULTISPECIES: LysR family transcriptional regulator [unclassified Nocardia]